MKLFKSILPFILAPSFALCIGTSYAQVTSPASPAVPPTIPFDCTIKVTNNTTKPITFKNPAATVNPGANTTIQSSDCRVTAPSTSPVKTTLSNGTAVEIFYDPAMKTQEVRIAGVPKAPAQVRIGADCVVICPGGGIPCYCDF